jgi:NitT/TauT family transport system substrate-binding protein
MLAFYSFDFEVAVVLIHGWRLVAICCLVLSPCNFVGCKPANDLASNARSPNSGRDKVVLVLNWYPEAEHGGYYAALVHGIYEKYGLDVEVRPGGKTTIVPQELTLGRIQFGIGNADDVLMAREQDAPLVALMAPMQDGPRCIMVREDSGISSFTDLKNITLQIDPSRPYVPFMKNQGLLQENVTTVPYFGAVAQLVSDARTAQQAYSFSEPFLAEQQGVKVRNLMMSEIGYNPYASVLIATESYLERNSDLTKRMVKASVEGWAKYLEDGKETNAYILKQNPEGITAEALTYGVEKLKVLCLPSGFETAKLGRMSIDRWETLAKQLRELKMISEKVDAKKAFSIDYLP